MSKTVYYCPVCKVRPIFIADTESETVSKHLSTLTEILETTPCSKCVDPLKYAEQLLKERKEGRE